MLFVTKIRNSFQPMSAKAICLKNETLSLPDNDLLDAIAIMLSQKAVGTN